MSYKVFFIAKFKSPLAYEYRELSKKIREVAEAQPGFIDITSEEIGDIEITVSTWRSKEDVYAWSKHPEHLNVKERSNEWYEWIRGIHINSSDEETLK